MEQITLECVQEMLRSGNIELKSTHAKLCFPVINRIYRKMAIGIKFSSIKVDGTLILDGHHRYIASLLSGVKLEISPYVKTSATVVSEWNEVTLDADDWDTEAKIRMLNEEDARYNGIELEKISILLK